MGSKMLYGLAVSGSLRLWPLRMHDHRGRPRGGGEKRPCAYALSSIRRALCHVTSIFFYMVCV
jgi:hypothetical protein